MTSGRTSLAAIYTAAFLRSATIGLLGVTLGVYLFRAGFSSTQIGLVIGAGLAGAALALALIGRYGDRLGRRRTLSLLAVLSGLGGLGLASTSNVAALLLIAFAGMINGMGTDRTAAYAVEQAIIPGFVPDQRRTWALSLYNLVLDSGHALGALAAAAPLAIAQAFKVDAIAAYRLVFLLLGCVNVLSAALYWLLSTQAEAAATTADTHHSPAPASRKAIHRLAALFAVDAFGGGFLTDALISYWFFRRFGLNEQQLALLFFAVHLLNAVSYLGAAWLARHFGLLNTMVFTHLPSSLFLIAVPLAPSAPLAVALFLVREALVEMDVPTRQSYVVAIVPPRQRTYASAVTNITRNVSWAVSSAAAGALMQRAGLAAPLYLGGSLKIVYDLLLYRGFRKIRPPEEVRNPGSGTASDSVAAANRTPRK